MYGQSGVRGIVQTRALSFSLYVLALVVGIVTIPLVLLGPDPDRRDPAAGLGLADHPLLAAGHPAHGRRADQPLPHLDAAPVALAARRPRRRAHPAHLAARLVRRARADRRLARWHLDLRPAVGPDRAAHLALRPGHRGAHRRRLQRRRARALAARGAAQPARALPRLGRRAAPHAHRAPARGRPAGTTRSTTTVPGPTTTTSASRGCATPRAAPSPRSPGPGATPHRRPCRAPLVAPASTRRRRVTGSTRSADRAARTRRDHRFGYRHGHRIMSASTPKGFPGSHGARGCSSVGRAQPCQG